MAPIDDRRLRWDATFSGLHSLSDLKSAVRKSTDESPCSYGLRSVCWKAFLLFENLDQSTWPKAITNSRSAYVSLRDHLLRDIRRKDDLSDTDPLADDENSPWNVLRKDEILRAEIFQDVERCMPDNLYFREPTTQATLLDILFIFCKLNPDIGYRQGMHELLAPVLWVVSRDAMALGAADYQNQSDSETDRLVKLVLDQQFLEHDAFTLFCVIMQTARGFYQIASNTNPTSSLSSGESPIVERSRRIHEDYLRRTDPELASHLASIEILPQIFLIRWIRLLFGREFAFDDLTRMWDVLFAEDPGLGLVDYICVAMLLRIRWQLLESDYSSALTMLLRYPPPDTKHPAISFVEDALFLRTNLDRASGAQLISKYSGKAPASHNVSTPGSPRRVGQRTPIGSSENIGRLSPIRSAGLLFQDSGIESMLQEAARGIHRQSERWGLNQALREALQGIQSGSSSPQRTPGAMRWSSSSASAAAAAADTGHAARGRDAGAELGKRLFALEERCRTLGKMTQSAIEGLTAQAQKLEEEKTSSEAANAIILMVAKLQFVQIYLENTTLPLGSEAAATTTTTTTHNDSDNSDDKTKSPGPEEDEPRREISDRSPLVTLSPSPSIIEGRHTSSRPSPSPGQRPSRSRKTDTTRAAEQGQQKPDDASNSPAPPPKRPPEISVPPSPRAPAAASEAQAAAVAPAPAPELAGTRPVQPTPVPAVPESPFHKSRPSLAQSSFSWMLGPAGGEGGGDGSSASKSASNSFSMPAASPPSSPFPSEKERKAAARGKASFLFGEERRTSKSDGRGESPRGAKAKAKATRKGADNNDEDADGFSLGTLRRHPPENNGDDKGGGDDDGDGSRS